MTAREITKLFADVEWTRTERHLWTASFKNEAARIKQLDEGTFAVYRGKHYLGAEATLQDATKRASLNKTSDSNRVGVAKMRAVELLAKLERMKGMKR